MLRGIACGLVSVCLVCAACGSSDDAAGLPGVVDGGQGQGGAGRAGGAMAGATAGSAGAAAGTIGSAGAIAGAGGAGMTAGQGGSMAGAAGGGAGMPSAGAAGRAGGASGVVAGMGGRAAGSGGSIAGAGGAAAGAGGAAAGAPGGTGGVVDDGPPAGNPNGACAVPSEAAAENTSSPRTVVGSGTPESCTSDAFVNAVAKGGVITFSCGANPKTIVLDRTAKIFNDTGPKIVIDGGGKITLSGGGKVRILYQNTCDEAQRFTTPQCQNQDHPQLTVQNLTFVDGNSKGQLVEGGGGGAIFVRGGRFKIVNTRFFRNVCDDVGPDLGGAAVRVLSQHQGLPAYVTNSTFGGRDGWGNTCSNGGGISSIGVSFTITNSLFAWNRAIGSGANPARAGTPGGGSGGAIYNDGNLFTLSLCGTSITNNSANEGGGAIFYVSNNRTGTLQIDRSVLTGNLSKGFETNGLPGIFALTGPAPIVTNSTIAK